MPTQPWLARDLERLGIAPGDLVMVHASLRAVGPVAGGGDTVMRALLDAVGESGTLAAYVDWEDEGSPFDPAASRAARSHGVLAELLRGWPGARRSLNPGASMAAVGARAEWLCADHPLRYGYGPGSPLAKLVEAGGKVLLLGSSLENVTLLHHAEDVARLAGKRVLRFAQPIVVDGVERRVEIEEFDTEHPVVPDAPDDYFGALVADALAAGLASTGPVGGATAHLFAARPLHEFAVGWMEARWGDVDSGSARSSRE